MGADVTLTLKSYYDAGGLCEVQELLTKFLIFKSREDGFSRLGYNENIYDIYDARR